jgi:Vta1 like/Vta1 C-terminal domain
MFIAASNFMDVLKMYGPLPEELEEKSKYAKWKAAEIMKQEQNLPSFSGKYPLPISKSTEELNVQIPDHLPADYKPTGFTVEPELLAQAEKYSRQAISAILFEDVTSALECLEKATSILKKAKK